MSFPLEGFVFDPVAGKPAREEHTVLPLPLCLLRCAQSASLALRYCAYAASKACQVVVVCHEDTRLPVMPELEVWTRVRLRYVAGHEELCSYLVLLQDVPHLLVIAEVERYARGAREALRLGGLLRAALEHGHDSLALAYSSAFLSTEMANAYQVYGSLFEPDWA